MSDDNLARHLDFARRRAEQQTPSVISWPGWTASSIPDATTIRPRWAGELFDLHACVQALFTIKLPNQPKTRSTSRIAQSAFVTGEQMDNT